MLIVKSKAIARCWLTFCLMAILILVSTGSSQTHQAATDQTGPTTWTVMVGGENGSWSFTRFYPENITINVNDTVTFKLNSYEPHTVFFPKPGENVPEFYIPEGDGSSRIILNPIVAFSGPTLNSAVTNGEGIVSSGVLGYRPPNPKEYNITFTKAGTFRYFCGLHRLMNGTVTVQPVGAPYPKTQAQIDSDAAKLLAADIDAAMKAEAEFGNVSSHPGPNGTTIYEVKVGYSNGYIATHRFLPENLTIRSGDSVEWTQNELDDLQTVTFASGSKAPELVLAEPQQKGPPKMVINPDYLAPAGGTTYSGKGFYNSGIMWGTSSPIPGPNNYSLTFDTPGTYRYISALLRKMTNFITVLAKN
jgi:plastocyanin